MKKIVIESPSLRDKRRILGSLKRNWRVYVIEPFCAHHHRGTMRFYPPPYPAYIDDLIRNGEISLITADQLDTRYLLMMAAERAVNAVEEVFPFYRDCNARLLEFVSRKLGTDAELLFKKNLCDRLGDFFSMNMMLKRLSDVLGQDPIFVIPHTNVEEYLYYHELVFMSGQEFYGNENIIFPLYLRKKCLFENILKRVKIISKLYLQAFGSLCCLLFTKTEAAGPVKKYRYGVSVVAPRRQFRGNQRGADFLIDNKKIHAEDVVYIPLVELNGGQMEALKGLGSDMFYLPRLGRFFSNWTAWACLVLLTITERISCSCDVVEIAAASLFTFFRWDYVMQRITFLHFITHCDFSNSHIPRNLLLQKKGIKTWYFTDATNFGHNFRKDNESWNLHPFWSYLTYDNFVTWNEDLAEFFSRHPESFRKIFVVGCLWSGHVGPSTDKVGVMTTFFDKEFVSGKFIIVVYTSSYTVKSLTSYEEGIEFVGHMKKLVDDFDDVLLLLKEKKDKAIHMKLEPKQGAKLLKLYDLMDNHPRIKIGSNKLDVSQIMAIADLCISFPFTSPTNEALGAQLPAIWHDPFGYYRDTPYGKVGGITTHSYEELKAKVMEIKLKKPGGYHNPIPANSPLMDPYRDRKAIDRFRDLLTSQRP